MVRRVAVQKVVFAASDEEAKERCMGAFKEEKN